MSDSVQEFSIWTRGRFLGVVSCLFVLQIGLIVLFGARVTKPEPLHPPTTQIRTAGAVMSQEQLRDLFFSSDPTVFPLPSQNGFSGRAWMNQRPTQYQSTNQLEAPNWLALDPSHLGNAVEALNDFKTTSTVELVRPRFRQVESPPAFLLSETVPTQSLFRIEGDLEKRLITSPPTLQAWPSSTTKMLTNTVVGIAVDQTGNILAAKLLTRCGSTEADADALAKTWALRFGPSPGVGTVWAQVVYQWQTTFPTLTGVKP